MNSEARAKKVRHIAPRLLHDDRCDFVQHPSGKLSARLAASQFGAVDAPHHRVGRCVLIGCILSLSVAQPPLPGVINLLSWLT